MEVKNINRNTLYNFLNSYNLHLRPNAFKYLLNYLNVNNSNKEGVKELLCNIIEYINSNNININFWELSLLEKILKRREEVNNGTNNIQDSEEAEDLFSNEMTKFLVFKSNFENTNIRYNDKFKWTETSTERNIFSFDRTESLLYKLNLFRNLIKKSNNFSLESDINYNYDIVLKEIGSIKCEFDNNEIYTYGIIGKEMNLLTLENEMSVFYIEFDKNCYNDYYIDYGQIVIVRGAYSNDKFLVNNIIMMDKFEYSNEVRNLINQNDFPYKDIYNYKIKFDNIDKIRIENFNQSNIFILNNFDLSNPATLNNFEVFTNQYCKLVGILVIVGPFWDSFSINNKIELNKFNSKINLLGNLLQKFLLSKIILVPDVNEFNNKFLPRNTLPEHYFKLLIRYNKNIILAENPCKFSYFSKNIYIIKEKFCKVLSKKTFVNLNDKLINTDILINTVIGQRSAICNSLSFPIHKSYESELLFTAFPDFIILCDDNSHMCSKIDEINNTSISIPGNFIKKNSFLIINTDKGYIEEKYLDLFN